MKNAAAARSQATLGSPQAQLPLLQRSLGEQTFTVFRKNESRLPAKRNLLNKGLLFKTRDGGRRDSLVANQPPPTRPTLVAKLRDGAQRVDMTFRNRIIAGHLIHPSFRIVPYMFMWISLSRVSMRYERTRVREPKSARVVVQHRIGNVRPVCSVQVDRRDLALGQQDCWRTSAI